MNKTPDEQRADFAARLLSRSAIDARYDDDAFAQDERLTDLPDLGENDGLGPDTHDVKERNSDSKDR
jgi:hypothetical protein